MTEADYVRKIVDALSDIGYAVKINSNNFSVKGTPDIIACIRGQMVVIETKVDGNTPSDKQDLELEKWANTGAIAIWVMDTYANSIQVRDFIKWAVDYRLSIECGHGFTGVSTANYWQKQLTYWMENRD